MSQQHLTILLNEYETVSEHWMLATRQKATLLQIVGAIVMTVVGASFAGHIKLVDCALLLPMVVTVAVFAYAQKEADFWAADSCMESIERRVNLIACAELLTYAHRYKPILFQRCSNYSSSALGSMQLLRVVPGIVGLIVCLYITFLEYGWRISLAESILFLISLYYVLYSRSHVITEADKRMKEELHAALAEKWSCSQRRILDDHDMETALGDTIGSRRSVEIDR